MTLKRTSPDSDRDSGAVPDSDRDSGAEPGPDSAYATGGTVDPVEPWVVGQGMFEDAGPISSVTYEPEEDTFAADVAVAAADGAKRKPGRPRKPETLKSAAQRFPGVFSAPASVPAAEPVVAPMGTFDAPSDANTPLASIRGNAKRGADVSNWAIYTVAELVRFRDEITAQLPATELSSLNLEQEVLLQYHTLRELQSDVLADTDTPANQRATVANSVASILKTLADQQASLYTSERFKDIENLLIRTLTLFPEDVAAKFIEEYEQILKNSGGK